MTTEELIERFEEKFGALVYAGTKTKMANRSIKNWLTQELEAWERDRIDGLAFCDCGDALERTGLYPGEATYYCSGCDETYILSLKDKS